MRIYLNAGHDIETASQIMTIIESSRGMAEVSMTVSGPQPTLKSTPVKWEGVSFINNSAYTNEGVPVWRAYGVGYGKFYLGTLSVNNAVALSLSQTSIQIM